MITTDDRCSSTISQKSGTVRSSGPCTSQPAQACVSLRQHDLECDKNLGGNVGPGRLLAQRAGEEAGIDEVVWRRLEQHSVGIIRHHIDIAVALLVATLLSGQAIARASTAQPLKLVNHNLHPRVNLLLEFSDQE